MMLTGRAETPRVTEISTSSKRPPMRIEKATQRGLKQRCYKVLNQYLHLEMVF